MFLQEEGILKGYPKCPVSISPIFANGHGSIWALDANGLLGDRGTPSTLKGYPKGLTSIFHKLLQMDMGANGHLGQMDFWGKEVPQVP